MKGWSYEKEWFEEGNVCKKVKKFLEDKKHYKIERFNKDKKAKGPDIIASKSSKKLIVEVKGYPSDYYVRGEKKGKKKRTPPKLQARHWLAEGLFQLIQRKSEYPDIEIGLGLPDKYSDLGFTEKIKCFKDAFKLTYFLVNEKGNVYTK